MIVFKYILIFPALALLMFLSCDDEPVAIAEAPKNIEGKWKIVTLTRNGIDLTQAVDLSAFRIAFNADNTYTLENYLPFIVKEGGTYALDDPQYPFKISFTTASNPETITTDLSYPVVQGKRQIRIMVSPGCQLNSYQYILEAVE